MRIKTYYYKIKRNKTRSSSVKALTLGQAKEIIAGKEGCRTGQIEITNIV